MKIPTLSELQKLAVIQTECHFLNAADQPLSTGTATLEEDKRSGVFVPQYLSLSGTKLKEVHSLLLANDCKLPITDLRLAHIRECGYWFRVVLDALSKSRR